MVDGLRVKTSPGKVLPGPAPQVKALRELSVSETAHLLERHFRVEAAVVQAGFRNVDGGTLSFYEEADLAQAGISSRPLARRIAEDLRSFAAGGVPLDLVGASVFNRAGASPPPKAPTHDAACSPFLRPADPSPPPSGSATPTAHLPVLASAAAPAPAAARPAPLQTENLPALQTVPSGKALPDGAARPGLLHASGASSDRHLTASHSAPTGAEEAKDARRRLSFESPRQATNALRRKSKEFGQWLGSVLGGSRDDRPGSRPGSAKRAARLEGELRRYGDPRALPKNVVSVRPDDAPPAALAGGDDADACRWTAHVRFDAEPRETPMRLLVPGGYPFKGPTAYFRDREVRFVMGQGEVDGNYEPYVLHATWTPAQSIADAIVAAMDEVRKAEFEEAVGGAISPM